MVELQPNPQPLVQQLAIGRSQDANSPHHQLFFHSGDLSFDAARNV